MVVAAQQNLEAPQYYKGYYSAASFTLTNKVCRLSKG